MIDEKKIEEAIPEVFANYCGVSKFIPVSNNFRGGFIEGINWFLGNLWHDASERMSFGRHILIEYNDNSYVVIRLRGENDRNNIPLKTKITRWLYIDDLLKGGK